MSALDELTQPLTPSEIEAAIYAAMASNGVNTTNWKPGAVVRTIVYACAIVLSACSSLLALIARSRFLDFAEGAWLRLTALYDYGTAWNGPTFASGSLTLNNTGGGIYSYAIGDLVFVNTVTQKLYRNTNAVSIGSLQTGVNVNVQAIEAGAASSALPGELAFTVPVPAVEIVQPDSLLGLDGERDAELVTRAREAAGALSPNGPADAYSYIAKKAKRADGTWIGITRTSTLRDGFGNVYLYVATDVGGISGTVGNLSTDLGRVDEECQRAATPLGVTLRTYSASPLAIPVTYIVWLPKSVNRTASQVAASIAAEIAAVLAAAPVGGYDATNISGGQIYLDLIRNAIGLARVDPTDPTSPRLGIFRMTVALPAGDTPVGASEVPVAGTIFGSVSFVGV